MDAMANLPPTQSVINQTIPSSSNVHRSFSQKNYHIIAKQLRKRLRIALFKIQSKRERTPLYRIMNSCRAVKQYGLENTPHQQEPLPTSSTTFCPSYTIDSKAEIRIQPTGLDYKHGIHIDKNRCLTPRYTTSISLQRENLALSTGSDQESGYSDDGYEGRRVPSIVSTTYHSPTTDHLMWINTPISDPIALVPVHSPHSQALNTSQLGHLQTCASIQPVKDGNSAEFEPITLPLRLKSLQPVNSTRHSRNIVTLPCLLQPLKPKTHCNQTHPLYMYNTCQRQQLPSLRTLSLLDCHGMTP
ncbi:hypothetical protein RTP6_007525 [Batrachochytrium dendrobatidis]